MGAQQGKEAAGGRPGGGGTLPPGPPLPGGQPPMAGRMGERQGSRIKGLRPPKQRMGAGGNIFTEHSGEYSSTASIRKYDAHIVSLSCVKPISHETYYSKIFRLRIMERWNKSVFILFLTFITNFNLFNVDHKDKSRHS